VAGRDRLGSSALGAAAASFAVFFVNVALGGLDRPVFLGDVDEALLLFAAVVLFVIGILARERRAQRRTDPTSGSKPG
jgi:hypothetical protein